MTEWQWVFLKMPWRVCELRRAEKDGSWNEIPPTPLGDGIPTLMVGSSACPLDLSQVPMIPMAGPLTLILVGITPPRSPQNAMLPWSCVQEGSAGISGFWVASLGSPAFLFRCGLCPSSAHHRAREGWVRIVCMASGWFPKPQVQWRALSGEKFLTFSETQAQGLFTIKAILVVRDSSSGNVTCSVLNPILGQEKAMAMFIPEPFFSWSSPWKLAFMVILTVLMLLLLGAAFYIMREHTAKLQEMQEWEKPHREQEEDQQIKEEALKARDELQGDLDWRKSVYLPGCLPFQP
ncbi:butyrophilin-like protein 1 isoform X2 [Mustela lutreola]|uniref:butyrophilin-like protein 1 isoform X2 n=1 Tax=Mustela lutreola TaxID=9666 RepID=UPI002797BC31|nr:butyrophilin-like protein 1 isoform X2 [Mustela lutreola]